MAIIDPSLSGAGSYNINLAGPSMIFLIADIFVYWVLLLLIEYGYFNCLFRRNTYFPSLTFLSGVAQKGENASEVDEDVLEE